MIKHLLEPCFLDSVIATGLVLNIKVASTVTAMQTITKLLPLSSEDLSVTRLAVSCSMLFISYT